MKYAKNTAVSVERSKAEMDAVLSKYGASHIRVVCTMGGVR